MSAPAPNSPDQFQINAPLAEQITQHRPEPRDRSDFEILVRASAGKNLLGWTTTTPYTADFTCAQGITPLFEPVDTTAGVVNGYLPATPVDGETHAFADITGQWATHNFTIQGNGANVNGAATLVCSTAFAVKHVQYSAAVGAWVAW